MWCKCSTIRPIEVYKGKDGEYYHNCHKRIKEEWVSKVLRLMNGANKEGVITYGRIKLD